LRSTENRCAWLVESRKRKATRDVPLHRRSTTWGCGKRTKPWEREVVVGCCRTVHRHVLLHHRLVFTNSCGLGHSVREHAIARLGGDRNVRVFASGGQHGCFIDGWLCHAEGGGALLLRWVWSCWLGARSGGGSGRVQMVCSNTIRLLWHVFFERLSCSFCDFGWRHLLLELWCTNTLYSSITYSEHAHLHSSPTSTTPSLS
jgi:hypothetical protein